LRNLITYRGEPVNNTPRQPTPEVPTVLFTDFAHFPKVRETNPRDLQIELAVQALRQNALLYLPTGAGKTLVAALVALVNRPSHHMMPLSVTLISYDFRQCGK
jgi:superfamily II DNA or RNA helicase